MAYVTPAILLATYGVRELLQASATSDPEHLVTADLLAATISGGDRSGYTADEIAAADAVLANLSEACTQAGAKVDAALLARWPGLTVPLASTPTDVARIALWVARYFVHDAIEDEEKSIIYRRYKDACTELRDLARGLTDLGVVPDADEATSRALPAVAAPAVTFTDSVLGAMP